MRQGKFSLLDEPIQEDGFFGVHVLPALETDGNGSVDDIEGAMAFDVPVSMPISRPSLYCLAIVTRNPAGQPPLPKLASPRNTRR